jgi:hypothetical protein
MLRILPLLAALAAAGPSLADSDARTVVSAAFGNTIVSTYPDGRTAELWLQPDGSYTAEGRRHDRSRGRWSVKEDKLCLKQSHPFAFGYVFCTPIRDVTVGSTWTAKAVTGEPIQVTLRRGKYDPAEG